MQDLRAVYRFYLWQCRFPPLCHKPQFKMLAVTLQDVGPGYLRYWLSLIVATCPIRSSRGGILQILCLEECPLACRGKGVCSVMVITLWNIINSPPGGLLVGLEDPVMLLGTEARIYERAHGMVNADCWNGFLPWLPSCIYSNIIAI